MILDTKTKLSLPEPLVLARWDELRALRVLWEGLDYLYKRVRRLEQTADRKASGWSPAGLPPDVRRLDSHPGAWTEVFGDHEIFDGLPMYFVEASFHWYSVSICNCVRLVGWLGNQPDPEGKKAEDYLSQVIPIVKIVA